MTTNKKVLLFSGGLNSATLLYSMIEQGFEVYALLFRYKQEQQKQELGRARKLARMNKIANHTMCFCDFLPDRYQSFYNSMLLAGAYMYARNVGADEIYVGVGYENAKSWLNNRMPLKNEEKEIKIKTPFFDLIKIDVVKLGLGLKVPFEQTWDCSKEGERPCLTCASCQLRAEGFLKNKIKDPVLTGEEWEKQIQILEK